MHDFKRTNKITGVHWLKEPVENLKICLRLKPQDGIMSLPKFEDYANETSSLNAETFEKVEEYTFKWQEKAFSLWETQRYSEIHNCITENELAYNNILSNTESEPTKVFTYIHDDYHFPLPSNVTKRKNIFDLNSCFEKLNLSEKIERVFVEETSSMGRLFRSEENLDVAEEQWVAMHVVFDSSDYNEDSQLVFKQEAVLLSLYHNITNNYLLVSPDSNQLELNPYTVETEAGVPLGYHYSVSVQFEQGESGEELALLLNKLHKKWEKKHRHLVNFAMPPLGRKALHLTLEVLDATGFEMDHLYIEFTIKLPEEIQCSDPLKGQTHACKIIRSEETEQWNFGHIAEFNLEIDVAAEPPPLQVFFEAISTDWWGRHRTEGYSYLVLPLQPGSTSKQLSCSRPEESDRVEAESRRFFVGGCHLIKDLDVLAKPHLQDTNFIYKTTGTIHIRWHVISQSPLPGYRPPEPTPGTSSASALLMGAEAVLRQYRRARAKLAAATKDLGTKDTERLDSSGDGVEESQA